MTIKQIKESALKLFDNNEVSKSKINNLNRLNKNIEVRSVCLNDFINDAQTELEQLQDLKIKAEVEQHNAENIYNKKRRINDECH